MNTFKNFFTGTIALFLVMGCSKDDQLNLAENEKNIPANGIYQSLNFTGFTFTIEEFEDQLETDISTITQTIVDSSEDYSNRDFVLQTASDYYDDDAHADSAFSDMYDLGESMPEASNFYPELSTDVVTYIEDIFDGVEDADEFGDAVSFLNTMHSDIQSDGSLSDSDMEFLLLFTTSSISALDLMNNSQEIIFTGLFGDKFKCAFKIVGGAITGALTGAALASSIPGVGTVAGAIYGGIAGGLTGASGC